MRKGNLITFIILVITFTGVSTATGGELTKNGFSVTLPDRWVEVPKNAVDSYVQDAELSLPYVKTRRYDYGFQLDSSKNWFEYPYILIRVDDAYRIPKKQLDNMERLKGYLAKEITNEGRKNYFPILSEIEPGKMVYDQQNNIIWMRREENLKKAGAISSLFGIVPTQRGSIEVYCYSRTENYQTYESVFLSVVKSISLESGLVYRPE